MAAQNAARRPNPAHELTITRVFDAPRALVYQLWSDPEQAQHWMGPRGFTACHITQDARPGGSWRLCLRPDDGGEDLWQGGVFREIVEPERIVFTFGWDSDPDWQTVVTVTFAERDGKTTMTFHQAFFPSVEERDGHRGGWNSAFDRLAELTAKQAA
jgi:uncharacterized protein YndB with AHSA1/START domain